MEIKINDGKIVWFNKVNSDYTFEFQVSKKRYEIFDYTSRLKEKKKGFL